MTNTNERRTTPGGFTLTELLIVIAIILVLTFSALPAVLGGLRDRKFSDAVRSVQAAFAGARDRAITSGQVRGLRFVRDGQDATDPSDLSAWEVSRIQYVGVLEPYSVGTVNNTVGAAGLNVIRADAIGPDPGWELVDYGKDDTSATKQLDDIPRVDAPRESAPTDVRNFESYIRFGQTGRLYQIAQVNDVTQMAGRSTLVLASIPPAIAPGTRYQIFGPAVPLANSDPILLPAGVVIDMRTPALPVATPPGSRPELELLRLPRSRGIPNQRPLVRAVLGNDLILGTGDDPVPFPKPATWPRMEILFAPDGMVTGRAAATDVLHFWIGERADRTAIGPDGIGGTIDDVPTARPHKMVTIVVRSGAIQVEDAPESVGDPALIPPYPNIYGRSEQNVGQSELPIP